MTDWLGQAYKQISLVTNNSNRETLDEFMDWMDGKRSVRTMSERMRIVVRMTNWIDKDFEDITKDDMKKYIREECKFKVYTKAQKEIIKNDDTIDKKDREPVKSASIDRYKAEIRFFFKWLHAERGDNLPMMKGDSYPEVVAWFDFANERKRLSKEDLLTPDEIYSLLEAENGNPRNQCLIAILYDSMGRLNEVLSLNENDIKKDKYGLYINIRDETSKTDGRPIRIKYSIPYIKQY